MSSDAPGNVDRGTFHVKRCRGVKEPWFCEACGETHDEVPSFIALSYPASWTAESAAHPESELLAAACVIRGDRFFFHALALIPVTNAPQTFEWRLWVEVAERDFITRCSRWFTTGRENDPPIRAQLAVTLPGYGGSTVGIPGLLQDQPVGLHPLFTISDPGHLLAREQKVGISVSRVVELAQASH